MSIRRVGLILLTALVVSACGASGVAPPVPTPTPTPPPGTVGTVTGSVAVAPTRVSPAPAGPSFPARTVTRRPTTLPVYVPNRLLVKFRPGVQGAERTAVHAQAGGTVSKEIPRLGVQIVRLPSNVPAAQALANYRASPLVEYAEQDVYVFKVAAPTDPSYPLQWHYPLINLENAWNVVTGAPGVIAAVVDTGIRPHPDLTGITVAGFDFFDNDSDPTDPGCPTVNSSDPSHGMHVSGTIAATTNNGVGVAGINWTGTKIMPIRVLGEDVPSGQCGVGSMGDVAAGITYAADHGAKVINLSLGGYGTTMTLTTAVNYAYGLGVTMVAAAGNDNTDIGASPFYPASYSNVLAVSAISCSNTKALYSNYGSPIDIAAPGGDDTVDCPGGIVGDMVLSTSWSPASGNGYWYFEGTSMAAPHVAGVLALMIARGITGPATLQSTLQSTATNLGAPSWDPIFGWGKVNAWAAVGGGSAARRLRAFSGVISGTTVTRQSDFGTVADDGDFTITNAQVGTKTVFAWQDFNGNNVVDTGDYFGQTLNVVINPGMTTSGVLVTVQRYSGPPLTVN